MTSKAIMAQNTFKYNRTEKKASVKKKIAMVICGLFIGAVNGLFGAGGGMLAVPALTYIGGYDEKSAHATAIALMLPLCLVTSVAYGVSATFDFRVVLPTVLGVAAGGAIGAILLKKLSSDLVTFLFYALMLFAGLKMIF